LTFSIVAALRRAILPNDIRLRSWQCCGFYINSDYCHTRQFPQLKIYLGGSCDLCFRFRWWACLRYTRE